MGKLSLMLKGDLSLSVPALLLSPRTMGDPRGRWALCSSPTATIKAKPTLFTERGEKLVTRKNPQNPQQHDNGKTAWDSVPHLCEVFEVFITISPSSADESWHQEVPYAWCPFLELTNAVQKQDREGKYPRNCSRPLPKSVQNYAHSSFTSACCTAWAKYQTMALPSKP